MTRYFLEVLQLALWAAIAIAAIFLLDKIFKLPEAIMKPVLNFLSWLKNNVFAGLVALAIAALGMFFLPFTGILALLSGAAIFAGTAGAMGGFSPPTKGGDTSSNKSGDGGGKWRVGSWWYDYASKKWIPAARLPDE